MRAWWPVLAAAALLGLGYVGQTVVESAVDAGRRSFEIEGAVVLDALVRVTAVALLVCFGWLVASGPRQRLPGLVMLVVGGYFALAPALGMALSTSTGAPMPPLTLEVASHPAGLVLWIGATVMVLGLFTLVSPTAPATPKRVERHGSVSRAEASPQPR